MNDYVVYYVFLCVGEKCYIWFLLPISLEEKIIQSVRMWPGKKSLRMEKIHILMGICRALSKEINRVIPDIKITRGLFMKLKTI